MLQDHPLIEVVGLAVDGLDGIQKIKQLRPDVVTLDVEMPRLNGIGVLERAAGKVPVSFVMVSSLTQAGARVTFEALDKGAFDYVAKPSSARVDDSAEFRIRLQQKVIAAARAKGRARPVKSTAAPTSAPTLPPSKARGWVVAIGISCGGPQTLTKMLPAFPSDFPPILVTQHMPASFTASFAKHLDAACGMHVKEAEHAEQVTSGTIYIAPGGRHMRLVRKGVNLCVGLDDGPKVSGHRPSVDVLFSSVARTCGQRSIGVIMTGMGSDGAAELATMRRGGAWTVAQDRKTSLVYGMPMEAVKLDAADHVVALGNIPLTISKLLIGGVKKTTAPSNI